MARPEIETPTYLAALRRMILAAGRRVAGGAGSRQAHNDTSEGSRLSSLRVAGGGWQSPGPQRHVRRVPTVLPPGRSWTDPLASCADFLYIGCQAPALRPPGLRAGLLRRPVLGHGRNPATDCHSEAACAFPRTLTSPGHTARCR